MRISYSLLLATLVCDDGGYLVLLRLSRTMFPDMEEAAWCEGCVYCYSLVKLVTALLLNERVCLSYCTGPPELLLFNTI